MAHRSLLDVTFRFVGGFTATQFFVPSMRCGVTRTSSPPPTWYDTQAAAPAGGGGGGGGNWLQRVGRGINNNINIINNNKQQQQHGGNGGSNGGSNSGGDMSCVGFVGASLIQADVDRLVLQYEWPSMLVVMVVVAGGGMAALLGAAATVWLSGVNGPANYAAAKRWLHSQAAAMRPQTS